MSSSTGLDVDDAGIDVTLAVPHGDAVAIRLERLTVRRQDDVPVAVRIEASAGVRAWNRIDAGALLHLDPEARGPVLGGAIDPTRPVRVEAVLDARATDELGDAGAAVLAARMGDRVGDDALRDVRRWWALAVLQDLAPPAELADATLRVGFRTVWSDDPPPAGNATVFEHAIAIAGHAPSREQTPDGRWIVRFEAGSALGLVQPRDDVGQAAVYLALARPCPPERRDELARLAALVNFDLPIGCLETSREHGLTRVRTSADLPLAVASLAVANGLVAAALHLAARWLPVAERVMDGADAEQALAAS